MHGKPAADLLWYWFPRLTGVIQYDSKDAGSVNVLYGSATGITTLHNQLWDQTGLDKDGGVEALDAFGSALAAGDFDRDGVADLAIGVPGEDVGIEIVILNAGSVDVLYGTVNHPPVADAGADQTVPVSNDNCFALVQLDGTGSSDRDGDTLTYVWTWSGGTLNGPTPQIVLTLGSHTFTLTVDDGFGGTDSDNVVITVVDQTPPVILGIEANPEVLWPPNHKFVPVTYNVRAKDNCDAAPVSGIVSVSSKKFPRTGHPTRRDSLFETFQEKSVFDGDHAGSLQAIVRPWREVPFR